MEKIDSILFVCLGNICRSPIAEGVARKLAEERGVELKLDSAGTGSWHVGNPPCANSITVAREHGVDITGLRARQVQKEDFGKFDLVVAMDAQNHADLKAMGCTNLVKMGDFGFGGASVPDPYHYREMEGFFKVYDMIAKAMENLFSTHFS